MALVDTYETLTASCETKRRQSHQQAFDQILASAGEQLDPLLVHAFVSVQESFDRIRAELAETN